jgi:hypothetical protein
MAALIRRENCQPNKFPSGVLLVQMKGVMVLCISKWCQDVELCFKKLDQESFVFMVWTLLCL